MGLKLEEVQKYLNYVPNTIKEETPIYLMFGKQPDRNWVVNQNRDYE